MSVQASLVLRGSKVMLRNFGEADITAAYVGWLNDPRVVRLSNQRFVTHDRASCLRYLGSFAGTPNLFLSVRRLDDEQAVGTMTVYISAPHGTADMGIMIGDVSVWGLGYGQDAWSTLMDWLLRQSIRKITAGTLACNHGMIKLMERSNMHLEAVRKQQEIVAGRPEDILYFARFRDA